MYTNYAYNAGASAANILADTTDKTTLSAACDQPNTSIVTTYAVAGWTVHDAAAGTNKQCLKAPCAYDAAVYKYVTIDTNTAGYVIITLCEGWNATTHAAIGVTTSAVSVIGNSQRVSTTLVGTLQIAASARYIMLFGAYAGTDGTSTSAGSPTGIVETSNCPWAAGSTYIGAVHIHVAGIGTMPATCLSHKTSANTAVNAVGTLELHSGLSHQAGLVDSNSHHYYTVDASGNKIALMWPVYAYAGSATLASCKFAGDFVTAGIYHIGWGAANGDTFVDNLGKTRKCFSIRGASTFGSLTVLY